MDEVTDEAKHFNTVTYKEGKITDGTLIQSLIKKEKITSVIVTMVELELNR